MDIKYIKFGVQLQHYREHTCRSLEHLSKGSLRDLTRKQNGYERYLKECVLLLTSLQGEMVR